MSTFNDIAQAYATRIRVASESALVKNASADRAPSSFTETIAEIVADLDKWTNQDGSPLTPRQIQEICRGVDSDLGLDDDTFWSVKKGSVQNLIAYQRQVLLMFNTLRFR